MARPLARHLLLRHGAVATLVRTASQAGALAGVRAAPHATQDVPQLPPRAADVDDLYSELVFQPW